MAIKPKSFISIFQRINQTGFVVTMVLTLAIGISACSHFREAQKPRQTSVHIMDPGTIQSVEPTIKKEAIKPITQKKAGIGDNRKKTLEKKPFLSTNEVGRLKEMYTFGKALKAENLYEFLRPGIWKPMRYFGPFLQEDFEEFDQVQILLDGSACNWYYNDYFNLLTTDQQFIYKMYYRTRWGSGTSFDSTILPSDPTPSQTYEPGGGYVPITGNITQYFAAKPILLSLNRIEYSSRYGGSVKLVFSLADIPPVTVEPRHADDFEFEFKAKVRVNPGETPANFDNYLFDLKELDISIFVWPRPNNFNPSSLFVDSSNYIQVEFEPGNLVAYKNGKPIPATLAAETLAGVFETLAPTIRDTHFYSDYYKHAARFTYGFLHDQFTSLLPPWKQMTDPRDTLDSIAISDDYIDIQTARRTEVFTMRYKMYDVVVDADPGGGEKIRLELDYLHAYKDKPAVEKNGRTYEIQSGGETGWEWVGTFNLDECNDILNINANVLVTEIDVLNPDDDFGYYVLPFQPHCVELEARNATDDFGLVERLRGEQNLYEGTSSVESGHYRWIMETYLGLR